MCEVHRPTRLRDVFGGMSERVSKSSNKSRCVHAGVDFNHTGALTMEMLSPVAKPVQMALAAQGQPGEGDADGLAGRTRRPPCLALLDPHPTADDAAGEVGVGTATAAILNGGEREWRGDWGHLCGVLLSNKQSRVRTFTQLTYLE